MVAIPARTPGPERLHRACTKYLTEADNLTVIENSYDTWRASSLSASSLRMTTSSSTTTATPLV